MEPIRVKLEDIKQEGVNLALDIEPSELELEELEDVKVSGNLAGEASVRRSGKKIVVNLRLEFTLVMPCSRCLKDTERRFSESEKFTLITTPPSLPPEQHLEEEDLTTVFFSGEEIDLAPLFREMVILAIPMKVLCKPDCKGLCPVCGADRNEETCGHGEETEPGDPRWAGLRELMKRKGK